MGMSQANPTDARSYFFDETNFVYRPYVSTTEVTTYLDLPKYRFGNFLIFINSTGTLNGDGTITGGVVDTYMFKNGTTNGNLVQIVEGATAYTGLSDGGSVNLPTVNTPLSNALALKAPLASPTFTGTVAGITKTMVGLGNADDTSDANKPISTATQTALDLKAPLNSPTFTGTVSGIDFVDLGDAATVDLPLINGPLTTALANKAEQYGDLTDSGTVDLPNQNVPLSNALDAKVNLEPFIVETPGTTTWDLDNEPRKEQSVSADIDITISGGVNGNMPAILVVTNTGTFEVSINGTLYATRPSGVGGGKTAIFVITLTSGYYVYTDYTYVPDVISPNIVNAEATGANTIILTLDEAVTGTDTGISFNDGSPLTISGMAGSGTNVLTFTIVETMVSGAVITYNITGSDLVDLSPQANPLANTSGSVTNSI